MCFVGLEKRLEGGMRRWWLEAMEFGIGNAECGKLEQKAERKEKMEDEKV
jgi:hypothetical protein